MRIIHNEQLLQKSLVELDLRSKFLTDKIRPVLCIYEKGELLTGPHIEQKYLLFLVSGMVQIYGVGADGRKIPVNLVKKGTVIGDVEFCNARNSNLFSEVIKDALCIGIYIPEYREILENDIGFLRFLLSSVSSKVYLTSTSDSPEISVEEKLFSYIRNECQDQILNGIEHAALRLQCSRRQLQRVIKSLCEQGKLIRLGKGRYKMTEKG